MEAESASGEQEGTVEWSESDSPLVIIWPLQIISIWHSGVYKDQIIETEAHNPLPDRLAVSRAIYHSQYTILLFQMGILLPKGQK